MRLSHVTVVAACLVLQGCLTLKAYDGARLPASDLARIQGDYKMRAGAPVTLVLRQVDGREVDVRFSSVDLLPGAHSLLVDCTIEGRAASRHRLQVEVAADRRYVIVAETARGNRECTDVRLLGVY